VRCNASRWDEERRCYASHRKTSLFKDNCGDCLYCRGGGGAWEQWGENNQSGMEGWGASSNPSTIGVPFTNEKSYNSPEKRGQIKILGEGGKRVMLKKKRLVFGRFGRKG